MNWSRAFGQTADFRRTDGEGIGYARVVAGVRVWGSITEASPESWDFILKVNLLAAAYCAKFAIPEIAHGGGGSIVNVSSANAIVGRTGMAQYDASKGEGAKGATAKPMTPQRQR